MQILSGHKLTKKIKNLSPGDEINQNNISDLSSADIFKIDLNDTKKNEILNKLKEQFDNASLDIKERFEDKVLKIRQGDDLLPSVMKMVKVFVAIKED